MDGEGTLMDDGLVSVVRTCSIFVGAPDVGDGLAAFARCGSFMGDLGTAAVCALRKKKGGVNLRNASPLDDCPGFANLLGEASTVGTSATGGSLPFFSGEL
eukprot:scaffold295546_cov23-Tisochrysis_lutea.AAC.2